MIEGTRKARRAYKPHTSIDTLTNLRNEIMVAEYNALRDEIINRMNNQQQILNFSIALIASVIAVRQFLPSENIQFIQTSLQIVYLFLSIFFSAFALMYIEHDLTIADIARYINKSLRPKLQKILDSKSHLGSNETVLDWDVFKSKIYFHSSRMANFIYTIMSACRYVLMVIPSIILITIYYLNQPHPFNTTAWEISLMSVSILLSLLSVVMLIIVRERYRQIV